VAAFDRYVDGLRTRVPDAFKGISLKTRKEWAVYNESGQRQAAAPSKDAAIERAIDVIHRQNLAAWEARKGGRIPRAPFVEKTDAWLSLAVKRMLMYAVDNGFDKIAFINGEQSAERYDLSKQIEKIVATKLTLQNRYEVKAYAKDGGSEVAGVYDEKELPDVVGKEMADRIIVATQKNPGKKVHFENLDLKVGGEGMKTFYNKIVPAVVNKVLKKIGGGQVETVDLVRTKDRKFVVSTSSGPTQWAVYDVQADGTSARHADSGTQASAQRLADQLNAKIGAKAMPQPAIEITPAMKEKIQGGLPMFSRLPTQPPVGRRFQLEAETKAEAATRAIQNEMLRLRRVQDEVLKQGGVVTEQNDAMLAAELMPGRILDQVERFDDNELAPLLEYIGSQGIELDELALFAYAKHAPERNARISAINSQIGPSGSGMSDADAAQVIADAQAAGKLTEFNEAHRQLMEMTRKTRDLMLSSGLLSQAEHQALQSYQNWMPLRGFESDIDEKGRQIGRGAGFSIQGKETMRAMGRRSRAGQLIENVVRDRARVIERAERALVGRTFAQFVLDNPDPGLWEVDVVVNKPRAVHTSQGLQVAYQPSPDTGDNVFVTKVAGAEVRITLKDEKLARAMKSLDDAGAVGPILEFMGTYNRWLSRMLTGMNPVFVVVNAFRDVQTAMFQGLRYGKHISRDVLRYWPAAFAAGMRKHYKGTALAKAFTIGNVAHWDAVLDRASAGGGRTGFFGLKTLADTNIELQRSLALHSKSASGWQKTQARLIQLAEAIEGVNDSVEIATRLSTYEAAKRGGATEKEALSIMKNITVNFNRRGELTKHLSPWFLFVNPSVQGTQVLYRALKDNPGVRYLAASLMGGSIALAMYGLSAGGDDDDGIPYWDKIPQEIKDRNLVIMLPPGEYKLDGVEETSRRGRYIKVPLPYGINIFNALGNAAFDGVRNARDGSGRPPAKVFQSLVNGAFMNWNPLGGESPWTQVAPIAQPLLQPIFNYNRFGRPLAPPVRPGDSTPPAERFFEGDRGGFAQATASGINTALGGDEATTAPPIAMLPEPLQNLFTPAAIRNTVGYATGGPGMFVDRAVLSPLVQANMRGDVEEGNLPFVRETYGTVDTRDQRRFYMDNAKDALKAFDRAKAKWMAGQDVSEADEVMASLGAAAEKYDQALGALKKQEIALKIDKELSAPERRVALNELELLRRQLYSDWLRTWKESTQESK